MTYQNHPSDSLRQVEDNLGGGCKRHQTNPGGRGTDVEEANEIHDELKDELPIVARDVDRVPEVGIVVTNTSGSVDDEDEVEGVRLYRSRSRMALDYAHNLV